jgi:hypothetical protein
MSNVNLCRGRRKGPKPVSREEEIPFPRLSATYPSSVCITEILPIVTFTFLFYLSLCSRFLIVVHGSEELNVGSVGGQKAA